MGHYNEALVTHEAAAAGREEKFERAAALAGFWAERGKTETAQHFYLDGLRSYRGVSPFPLALLDFQLGLMWMRQDRLSEARTGTSGARSAACRLMRRRRDIWPRSTLYWAGQMPRLAG